MKIKNRTLLDHLLVVFSTGGTRAFALAVTIVIAKRYGKEALGMFSYFNAAAIVTWLSLQSLDTAYIRLVAKNSETREKTLAALLVVKIVVLVLLCLVAAVIQKMNLFGYNTEELLRLAVQGVVFGACLAVAGVLSAYYQSMQRFFCYSISSGAYSVIGFLVVIFIAWTLRNASVELVIISYQVIGASLAIFSCVMLFLGKMLDFGKVGSCLVELLKLGKWIFATNFAFFMVSRVDVLLLPNYVELQELGSYTAATQVVMLAAIVSGSMGVVLMPKAMEAVKSAEGLRKYCTDSLASLSIIMAIMLFLGVFAQDLLVIAFGPEFVTAVRSQRLLLLGYAFSAVYTPISFLFYGYDAHKLRFLLELMKLLTAVACIYLLAPKFRASGAAAAMCIAMSFTTIAAYCIFSILHRNRRKEARARDADVVSH